MPIIIATCNDIPEFGENRLLERDWSSRFIGTGWVTQLHARAQHLQWTVASGDIALAKVRAGEWKASDILVVQELAARQGKQLIDAGASPLLLTCMESPLYAPLFYDKMPLWRQKFPHTMLPGAIDDKDAVGGASRLRFPCYWDDEVLPVETFAGRQEVVLFAGNKYWSSRPHLPFRTARRLLSAIRQEVRLAFSSTRRIASEIQLHDERLALVASLSRRGMLDIYGAGWSNLSHLPAQWQRLLGQVPLRSHGSAEAKIPRQAGFKFALCAENARYPGYVTEKIVQCFVSGTIPVYLGAPDIAEFVPPECYIDAHAMPSAEALPDYLSAFDDGKAQLMLAAGRHFLSTPAGRLHSYSGFADWVVTIVQEHLSAGQR